MLLCGANCMGFYNVRDHVWACGFDSGDHAAPGKVALISHSGSGMCGLVDSEARLQINLAVSTGNELAVSMDEYLDFVLDLPETKAVGLFVETARNPAGFRAALEKAVQRRIPIVAIKVGRTEKSAQLAVSHSGAIAGDDAAYDALFDHYGVQRVRDMDEMATALILFAETPLPGAGGLVSLHDSGGERQLMIDLCDEAAVPLTELSDRTTTTLRESLDPELPAVNPLDGWSRGGPGSEERMTRCLTTLMQDPGAAMGALVLDRAPNGGVYPGYLERMKQARAESGKPVALVAARQGTGYDEAVITSTHAGMPVLDGIPVFLRGVRALFSYRDFLSRESQAVPGVDSVTVEHWRKCLGENSDSGEAESLQLFADFGLPVPTFASVTDKEALIAAAEDIGYPVVLKTAAHGILHKSDKGGVVLGIEDEHGLVAAYAEMSERLGPDVIVAAMADSGIEMMLGVRRDTQFGPVVLIGFGGINVEALQDVVFALPPFSERHARRCVDRLKLRPFLDGVRGKPAVDIDAFCELAARFSVLVDALRHELAEVDVNPVIVHESGCTIVDALVFAS
jgi:acyl-CoA synthetase (NDP forming)